MATIKNTNNKFCGEKGKPHMLLVGM
jgi:hypothetical protein